MATASELFLVMLRYWLVIGGTMTRSACGSSDQPHHLAARQAERHRRLALALVQREDAGRARSRR